MRPGWRDALLTRRSLIAGTAGLIVARAAHADLLATPSQSKGPFYPRVKPLDSDADMTLVKGASGPARGEVIEVTGRILSVRGHAMGGATVEIWQADAFGRYNHPHDRGGGRRDVNFQGFGAVRTDSDGGYRFRTVRPRHYDTGAGVRTPHIHFRIVYADGREFATQMYFPGEARNRQDWLYQSLRDGAERAAATARREEGALPRYLFDLVLADA